ncbi:ATP-binding cassette domain-containing protein [Oxalobacter aliiformigenes]|uniref:ATP-binding protein Uup n=1 Tax=Oxalobacter aliiformigenes TaxID=2946593 RepID=A0ABY7JIS2_9BURK|nr:ATP-binding cassette domain-containing protein [Oxalobacter aliiformigenes]WAV93813.1 ATP-binding cassette domain-containing protein [Oxalobacter aliiformigenes]WAV97507.1 ATP-binding cassette domain-containing protein [Oxalobacter aliiformigenes]
MAIITLTDAQLAFGHFPMLDHAEFSLEAGEKVGLIGRNGTGKSSLLQVLAGKAPLDDGLLTVQQNLKISYVEQEPVFPADQTVYDAVASGLREIQVLLQEYEDLTSRLEKNSDSKILDRLNELQIRLDATDAWNLNNRVETILDRLSLARNDLVGTLSGGLYKRVALAHGLIGSPDVLMLDEPTNHLDFESIIWLEDILKEFRGSLIFITHDRRFLDNIATRIIELDRGKLLSFPGNFSAYKKAKNEQLANEAVENAKFDKFLAQEEIWIRKGIEARRTRNEGRVRRLEALRATRAARREHQGQVRMDVSTGERSGKLVAELTGVSKSFGDKTIVKSFSDTILRGDKIGLIGPNGVGKTTLLKLILGELAPDAGNIRLGTKLQIAYFDQMRAQLDDNASLVDTISPGSEWIEIGNQKKHVMSYLSDFLFTPERARSPVKSLSGGERNRLLLARLFARPANVLVLDEPTNDLDIDTLELLEELLQEYNGTVFLVSHDRAFLDNVVTQVIAAEGQGLWREYIGGYSDWERIRPVPPQKAEEKKAGNKTATAPVRKESSGSARRKKLSYKDQRELDELPSKIAALENEQAQISTRLNDPELYKGDPAEGIRLNRRFAEIEEELMNCITRWDELESKTQD